VQLSCAFLNADIHVLSCAFATNAPNSYAYERCIVEDKRLTGRVGSSCREGAGRRVKREKLLGRRSQTKIVIVRCVNSTLKWFLVINTTEMALISLIRQSLVRSRNIGDVNTFLEYIILIARIVISILRFNDGVRRVSGCQVLTVLEISQAQS